MNLILFHFKVLHDFHDSIQMDFYWEMQTYFSERIKIHISRCSLLMSDDITIQFNEKMQLQEVCNWWNQLWLCGLTIYKLDRCRQCCVLNSVYMMKLSVEMSVWLRRDKLNRLRASTGSVPMDFCHMFCQIASVMGYERALCTSEHDFLCVNGIHV